MLIIFPRNVSFRGYYAFVSNAAAAPPPRHNFVVSAITFEGFKLRSSNLTHALFIQISRTSSITDIVVQSKMAAGGHFVQKFQKKIKVAYRSEMAIKSYFRTSKIAADGHFVQNLKKARFPTFPHFSLLFAAFSHFPHFPPLFTTFSNFSPLFHTFIHFSPLFATFSNFPHFSSLFPTFSHFSLLFPTFPHF